MRYLAFTTARLIARRPPLLRIALRDIGSPTFSPDDIVNPRNYLEKHEDNGDTQ